MTPAKLPEVQQQTMKPRQVSQLYTASRMGTTVIF